jgi:succinate dehydrogenase / fumarate reductase membrane anchor subunit
MTTQTLGKTIRTVKPLSKARNNFERTMWTFMRYSGLILVLLSLTHFGHQHLIISTQSLTSNDTVARWGEAGKAVSVSNLAWRAYYMAILGLAMLHGLNGVRQVAFDYIGSKPLLYKAFMGLVAFLTVLVTILGALALIFGATKM